MSKIEKYKISKYKISKYEPLAILKKVANVQE